MLAVRLFLFYGFCVFSCVLFLSVSLSFWRINVFIKARHTSHRPISLFDGTNSLATNPPHVKPSNVIRYRPELAAWCVTSHSRGVALSRLYYINGPVISYNRPIRIWLITWVHIGTSCVHGAISHWCMLNKCIYNNITGQAWNVK